LNLSEVLEVRGRRGYEIAKTKTITRKGKTWFVPSETNPGRLYEVIFKNDGHPSCTCEDYVGRNFKCKHIFAIEFTMQKGATAKPVRRKTYPQEWPAYDQASIQQKELFLKLLSGLCNTIPEPTYTFGRPKLPLKDMVFSSALKVYTTFSLRRFSTDMKAAQEKGLIEKAPYYSTVARYMESPQLTPILNELITTSSLPLKSVESNFGIDSTGFSPSKFSRWFSHKYGKETDRKIWYKLHVVNGSSTHIITACEATLQYINDMTQLPTLIEDTHKNFDIKELSADKGYLSELNILFMDKMGINSYIPFKSNTMKEKPKYDKHSQIWWNAYNYFSMNQSAFLQHYHQRSNTETVMHMVKSKFGDSVRSKTETACINEILLKALCHNICVLIQEMFELGIKPEFLGA